MTKEELLGTLQACAQSMINSRLNSGYEEFETKKILLRDYTELIRASLTFCPKELALDGISSIEEMGSSDEFRENVQKMSAEELKIRLSTILSEIKTLANIYASQNAVKLRNTATALAIRTEWLDKRQARNHKIIFPIFIAIFIVLSIAVVVCAILDAGQVFAKDSSMATACSIVASVAGALDAVNGVAFFVYERRDDKKKQSNQFDMDQAIGRRVEKNSRNVIKAGKGATVRIGDRRSGEPSEDALDAYIIKNSGNELKAKKNSRIDIGDR